MAGVSVRPQLVMVTVVVVIMIMATAAEGFISRKTWRAIRQADRDGPFVGLVVPNAYEMEPVLNSPAFKPTNILDVQGSFFHSHSRMQIYRRSNPLILHACRHDDVFFFFIYIFQGRRFRFGTIGDQNVVMVMTGLSMVCI